LRALERAEAKQTPARARALAAVAGHRAYEDEGQGSAAAWLPWQTRTTRGAADGSLSWAPRVAAHPVTAAALAAAALSEPWARPGRAWPDNLPAGRKGDDEQILAAAARGGVALTGLGGLAEEMHESSHRDRDGDVPDGLADRAVWLDTTIGGAGRLAGDLSAG